MDKGIELRKVVDQLREELSGLAQTVKGEELQLIVESIDLELHVGVTKSVEANGKAKFWVLEVGGKGEYATERTQVIKLKLKPKLRDAKPGTELLVNDGSARGERTAG